LKKPSRKLVFREWAGYWILAALVLFEFWDAQDWHSRYMACCAEKRQLRSGQQLQSSLQKPEYRVFDEIPTPTEAQPFDLPPPHINRAQLFLGLPCSETPKSSRNNLVSVYAINTETIRVWFSPSSSRTVFLRRSQPQPSDGAIEKPYRSWPNT